MSHVRVRFAPSPTGGLHLGGVRTVLYNYLFAKHHGGDFIVRIEDTDQSRFVPGAEDYIFKCLEWCGLAPDESTQVGGPYAPYRQSERKPIYRQYAQQLIDNGHAYYAFDTPSELEDMRQRLRTDTYTNPQYDANTRPFMRNSLSLPEAEVAALLAADAPYVIRIKMPEHQHLQIQDMIRGNVSFDTSLVDDKVLLKADGMPTYHLAVVVDDYLMNITHVFRGEEWLPSAPVHLLLWEYLGWHDRTPKWAHLPLILRPDGHGKLSKRDGDRLGFPVFAMDWTDPVTGEVISGFRERGFLPEAFVNMLAMLGWHDGSEQEVYSLSQLVAAFSIDRVHKAGARFDYEKAKWFNHQHIQHRPNTELATLLLPFLAQHQATPDHDWLTRIVALVKERCSLLTDFWAQSHFFFQPPETIAIDAIQGKWNDSKTEFFNQWIVALEACSDSSAPALETVFNELLAQYPLKKGDVLLPFRIMLVGDKYGPGVFDIASLIGAAETTARVRRTLALI